MVTTFNLSTDHRKVMFLWKYCVHRRHDFGLQNPDGSYKRVNGNITLDLLLKHVRGEITIGTYQLTRDNTVSWIVYDIDDHEGHGNSDIEYSCVLDVLYKHSVVPLVERSGSPGSYHLWVFLVEPVNASDVYRVARQLITDRGVLVSGCEVFPKQERLNPAKPYGNLVKLPLGVNRRHDVYSHFENVDELKLYSLADLEVPEEVDVTAKKEAIETSNASSGAPQVMSYAGVRPCVLWLLENVQMEHYDGHKLRIACGSEMLAVTDMSDSDIAELFNKQNDYDFDESLRGVTSLHGYRRPKCDTIKHHCKALNVDIESICKECVLE